MRTQPKQQIRKSGKTGNTQNQLCFSPSGLFIFKENTPENLPPVQVLVNCVITICKTKGLDQGQSGFLVLIYIKLSSSLDNIDAWALSPESLIQVVYSTGIGSVARKKSPATSEDKG